MTNQKINEFVELLDKFIYANDRLNAWAEVVELDDDADCISQLQLDYYKQEYENLRQQIIDAYANKNKKN